MFVLDYFSGFAGDIINGAEFDRNGNADDVSGYLPGLVESVKAVFRRRCRGFKGIRVFEE